MLAILVVDVGKDEALGGGAFVGGGASGCTSESRSESESEEDD